MKHTALTLTALLALHSLPLAAQPLCANAGPAQPVALFERFTSADCASCWQDYTTPAPGPDALVLDWIVPGTLGDDAPLAPAATRDALLRLQALDRAVPAATMPNGRSRPCEISLIPSAMSSKKTDKNAPGVIW